MRLLPKQTVELPELKTMVGTGWLPPTPDLRDYTEENADIPEMAKKLKIAAGAAAALPKQVDLRAWCSAIEDQQQLGSCTAHAAMGVIEYLERRGFNKYIDGSRLFVYKTTRNLMEVVGDTGAWLRYTIGAMALCGVPPEKYWPYTDNQHPGPAGERTFDDEPTAFVYALADNYEALRYFSHDPIGRNVPYDQVLQSVKRYLAAGVPSMFGFWGFPSFGDTDASGNIPYPCAGERPQWGHAIVAVGYDDNKKVKNTRCNKESTGAFLIRNSWSPSWGDKGYGWMPYDYVLSGYALDFWSLLSMGWVNTGQFGL